MQNNVCMYVEYNLLQIVRKSKINDQYEILNVFKLDMYLSKEKYEFKISFR